jgi:hypothetical protein
VAKNDAAAVTEPVGNTTPVPGDTPEPSEFPVTLEEFLSEIPKARVETKAAFTHLCQAEKINDRKYRSEWAKLLGLFETMPTALTWAEWQIKGGK